jgi:hypothetical protein
MSPRRTVSSAGAPILTPLWRAGRRGPHPRDADRIRPQIAWRVVKEKR